MAWIERSTTRTSQPQELSVVDITTFPKLANLAIWQTNQTTYLTPTENGAPAIEGGPMGTAFGLHGVNPLSSTGLGFNTGVTALPSALTFAVVFSSDDAPQNTVAFGSPIAKDQYGLNWHHNQSDYRAAFTMHVGGNYPRIQFPDAIAGKIYSVVGTWDGLVMSLFINGQFVGSTAAIGPLNPSDSNAIRLMTTATNGSFNGQLFLAHLGDSCASFSEAISLSQNPWQIFEPTVEYVWVDDFVSTGTTPVDSDRLINYLINTSSTTDLPLNYSIRTSAIQDAIFEYSINSSLSSDRSAAYNIRASASSDDLNQYLIRTFANSDIISSFNTRTSAANDEAVNYLIRANAEADANYSFNTRTNAFPEGAVLYLSPTIPGGITSVIPVSPNRNVRVGYCVRSHATVGSIFVNIINDPELSELPDVLVQTPQNRLCDNSKSSI